MDSRAMTSKKRFTEAEFKEIRETLIAQAKKRWPNHVVQPCGKKTDLSECFTIDIIKGGYLVLFWYNVLNDTHVEKINFYLKFDKNGKKNDQR